MTPLQVIDLSKEQERTKQQEFRSKQAEFEAATKRAAVVRTSQTHLTVPGQQLLHLAVSRSRCKRHKLLRHPYNISGHS